MKLNQENLYWLFSSSAQAISAFVAFLLTGYVFVHAVMEGIQQRDDSLVEVHHELRRRYYSQIRLLSVVTGLAILASLAMVYLNGTEFRWNAFFAIITSALNVFAIIGGLLFVLSIIDPDKYKKTASKLVAKEEEEKPPVGGTVSDATFFDEFIRLELQVKSILADRGVFPPTERGQQFWSFRQMITALYHNELIPPQLYNELLEISKYRNLVFHGQVHQVDQRMLEQVRSVRQQLDSL